MQKLGNRRITGTEQYYTPPELSFELAKTVVDLVGANRRFLEPAGGNGSFVEALENLGARAVVAVDLHPKDHRVARGDFLTFNPQGLDFVTVSNPPFGRNNALSIPFFNHAAEFSDLIAFLVPRSWRKWSVTNRLDQRFHLVSDVDVLVNYVDEHGQRIGQNNDLRTCFQIWEKREQPRGVMKVQDNRFVEKCGPTEADLAIRVFGYGCGKVYRNFPRVANTTLMFLRVLEKKVFDVVEGLDYERFINNTAYTQALAFPELNYLLNQALLGDPMLRLEAKK
ncbi:MAG: hypothetical protein RL068_652 [Actinomycetota bacterium]